MQRADSPSTSSQLDLLAEGFAFLECPRWAYGRIWAVDMFGGQALSFSRSGAVERALDVQGAPVGLDWDSDDRLLVLTGDGRMLRERHGQLVELPNRIDPGPATCNELTLDAANRAFIGIFGLRTGGLTRLDPDGATRIAATDLLLPNGQTLSVDGRTLIVAESAGQRLTAFTLTPEGELIDRRVWASFGPPPSATALPDAVREVSVWPDGIALDGDGAIWVANPFGHEVICVRQGGEVTDQVSTGKLTPYACALGGDDGRTLFICAAPPALDISTRRAERSACLLATRLAGFA